MQQVRAYMRVLGVVVRAYVCVRACEILPIAIQVYQSVTP